MKKPELLAPAGSMEALYAAIEAGCDAIYLGGYMFGARSFAGNFSNEEIIEAVNYAHLYNVKIYVTTNTIIYEDEMETFINYIDFLYNNNVDAVIVQDLGAMDLIRKLYPDFEIHASTQMHIHNLEGVKLVEKLGLTRAVIARETNIETIKKIKENTNIELEVFVHGALCISYSGQCFMSTLIGSRSGNRGTCAQSCRQKYTLSEQENNTLENITREEYLLSTKDLNTLENLGTLIESGADSFKIEGRMKRPEYVYLVVSLYRKAIDSYFETGQVNISEEDIIELKKIFNREFTKGFLFNENNNKITNPFRPNHMGIKIGKVVESTNKTVKIKLEESVFIKDGIRILTSEDYGLNLNVFTIDNKIVKEAYSGDIIELEVKAKLEPGSIVLKTTDIKQIENIEKSLNNKIRKVPLTIKATIKNNMPMEITLESSGVILNHISEYRPELATNTPTTKEKVLEQLLKLGNTIYSSSSVELDMEDNLFISIKEINELRRKALELLNAKRLLRKHLGKQLYEIEVPNFVQEQKTSYFVRTIDAYNGVKDKKMDYLYLEEPLYGSLDNPLKILKLPRVKNNFDELTGELLVGELGSIHKYENINTDFSLNVTNSYAVAFLHSLGINRVTLSIELNDEQIKELVVGYKKRYNKNPNLELIVSGYREAMIMKYDLLKKHNKKDHMYLKDRFNNLYKIYSFDEYMIIYNTKPTVLDNINNYYEMGINTLRYEE